MEAAQQTFQEQMACILQQTSELEDKVRTVSKPRVSNVAAQILLLACGLEDFHQTTTHHFSVLGVKDPRIKAVCGLLGVQPRVFVTQADALVTSRNNIHNHFSSRAALDKKVAEVAGLIDSDLRRELRWECKGVAHYGTIKRSMPQ